MVRVFVYDEVIELVKDHYYEAKVSVNIFLEFSLGSDLLSILLISSFCNIV